MHTSVPVALIDPAVANLAMKFSAPLVMQYLSEEASIDAIVSPQIVIVVSGALYVDGIDTIAHRTVEDSVHLITIPFATYVVTSPVTVKVVLDVRVGVPGMRTHEDALPPEGAALVHLLQSLVITFPEVPGAGTAY